MELRKTTKVESLVELNEEALAKINAYTLKEYTADELFAFKIKVCDNDIDRDYEAFTEKTLEQLAELFKGKTVLFNHSWNSKDQSARIYETEVVSDESQKNWKGEVYKYLLAYAYIPKTEKNADLIENILSGINKEVSVGCSVKKGSCSICGADVTKQPYYMPWSCGHIKGKKYDGKTCAKVLSDASDAYEVSFVAVPAQPQAGTIKSFEEEPEKGEEEIEKSLESPNEEPSFTAKVLNILGGN